MQSRENIFAKIYKAVKEDNFAAVDKYVQDNPSVLGDVQLISSLNRAITISTQNSRSIALYLIEKISPDIINHTDKDLTPLHFAMAHQKVEIAKRLIQKGARMDQKAQEIAERRGIAGQFPSLTHPSVSMPSASKRDITVSTVLTDEVNYSPKKSRYGAGPSTSTHTRKMDYFIEEAKSRQMVGYNPPSILSYLAIKQSHAQIVQSLEMSKQDRYDQAGRFIVKGFNSLATPVKDKDKDVFLTHHHYATHEGLIAFVKNFYIQLRQKEKVKDILENEKNRKTNEVDLQSHQSKSSKAAEMNMAFVLIKIKQSDHTESQKIIVCPSGPGKHEKGTIWDEMRAVIQELQHVTNDYELLWLGTYADTTDNGNEKFKKLVEDSLAAIHAERKIDVLPKHCSERKIANEVAKLKACNQEVVVVDIENTVLGPSFYQSQDYKKRLPCEDQCQVIAPVYQGITNLPSHVVTMREVVQFNELDKEIASLNQVVGELNDVRNSRSFHSMLKESLASYKLQLDKKINEGDIKKGKSKLAELSDQLTDLILKIDALMRASKESFDEFNQKIREALTALHKKISAINMKTDISFTSYELCGLVINEGTNCAAILEKLSQVCQSSIEKLAFYQAAPQNLKLKQEEKAALIESTHLPFGLTSPLRAESFFTGRGSVAPEPQPGSQHPYSWSKKRSYQ